VIGVSFLIEASSLRGRGDKTRLWLTSLTGVAITLRAALYLHRYAYHTQEYSITQAKASGWVSGIACGLGIALVTHLVVRKYSKSPGV
jgi:hypothetical protein